MNFKFLSIISCILFVILIIWIVLMIITMAPIQSDWGPEEFVYFVASQGKLFTLSYLNAGIITILVVFLFAALYYNYRDINPPLALAGILLIPVYAVMNFIVYFSQIIIVPIILSALDPADFSMTYTAQWLQCNFHSPIAVINGLAYAILGIPSIIFGWLIHTKNQGYRWAAYLLMFNALSCILGIVGYITSNRILSMGTVLGGIIFTVAVLLFCFAPKGKMSVVE